MKIINAKDANAVKEAAEAIRSGSIVAFPTDTVYGVGADATNAAAVRRIYRVKGRRGDKPLAFLIADMEEIGRYLDEIPPAATLLAERFWPGPLTIILRGSGGRSVAFRMPDHPFALALIREAGVPLVATSANISGERAPVDAESVRASLGESVDLLVDGGRTAHGEGSTTVDLSGAVVRVGREGPISEEEIADAISSLQNSKFNMQSARQRSEND